MDRLPFQITEELKTKNLYPFVVPEESSCNKITLLIYENQKFRPIIGSWGNVIGVHIFPNVDRKPFTNEYGNKSLQGSLEDIQPINGFQWTAGGWELVLDKGVGDEDGWQYARNWSNLKDTKHPSNAERTFSFVRRRRWKRTMEINLESVQQSLPYELLCRIQLAIRQPNNLQAATLLYVEIDVNEQEQDNGVIAPPNWFKDFTIPLTHLSPFKKFTIKLLRNAKLLTSFNHNKFTEELSLADIMQITKETGSVYRKIIYQEKSFEIEVEWKIVENTIFHIVNKEKYYSKGELQEMILSEAKLSQRLKEKIIMLSLALGNEKCHSLLREITSLMVEGQYYLDDLDLIEVLDDVNQISGGNEFEKVLSLFKDVDRVQKIYYPSSIFSFGIFLEIQNQQRWNLRKPNHEDILHRIDELYDRCASWFFGQPSCFPFILNSYHGRWVREMKSSLNNNASNSSVFSPNKSPYSVILLLKDEAMTFELIARNISDYISLLRILSIAKYYHQTGFYHKMSFYSPEILSVNVIIKIDKKIFLDGSVYVDSEDGSIEFSTLRTNAETSVFFPLKLPFEYFDGAILSHSFHYSLHYLVEIKVLSATSFALPGATDAMFRLNIDTMNGQHQQCDFLLTQDSANQPVTGSIDQTFHLLMPAEIVEYPERLEHYATVTFSVDQSTITKSGNGSANAISTPPRTNSQKANAVEPGSGNRDKRDKRVSISFGNSNGTFGGSNNDLLRQKQQKKINSQSLAILGQSSIFANNRGVKNENEFQVAFEKVSSFRLKIFLRQFSWMIDATSSSTYSDLFCMIYLVDRDGEILVPAVPLNETPSKKKPSSHSSGRQGHAFFRSSVTSKKSEYSWSNESIEIDSKQIHALELASYLLLEVWSKGVGGNGKYNDEDHLLGEGYISINPYKFMNAANLDCLIHQPDATTKDGSEDKQGSSAFPIVGLGHLQVKLHSITNAEGPTTPTNQLGARTSSRIRSNNLVKLSISSKPIQPTDCAWPAHIINHTEKTIDPNIFYFSVNQDGIHILTENVTGGPLTDKAAILEECMEKVYTSTPGKLQLIVKYENIRLDEIFILNDNTLLVGIQFRRKMHGKDGKALTKAVFREIRFEFLIGPCLAEDIYVTIANKVTLQPLRNQLVSHVQSSDKELEESFTSIAKLFQDTIYETITNISTALVDLKAIDDLSERDSSPKISIVDDRNSQRISKRGIDDGNDNKSSEKSEELHQRQIERETETLRRLQEVESWNKLLPKLINTTNASSVPGGSSVSAMSFMHSCTLKLLYLKKATLMIYLWYLIEQSPIPLGAEKHYMEASWILFDEIEQHVNSEVMNKEDLETLLYRIKDIMQKLEKEVRYTVLRAFRITTGSDVSLELSKCIYEKYITIVSMLLGTLEFSEFDFESHSQQQQQHSQLNDIRSSESVNGRSFPTHKSYIISNPQKKRDLIKFIIINDNMFEEYCNAILISHHYNFNKRPLLSLCINFDSLLEKFSHILDENLLMWNHRIIKYFMNTREEESNMLTAATNTNTTVQSKQQQKEEDLLLLQTSKNKSFYGFPSSSSRDSVTMNHGNTGNNGSTKNTVSSSQLLPWDITLYKENNKELFISNIPETIQLQLNIEIGLKKITPMYLEDGKDGSGGKTTDLLLLEQDEESLYRIDLMNNKIAQAIARSYITLAAEFEKILLSDLIQNPDLVMSMNQQPPNNSSTKFSLLSSSDTSVTPSSSMKANNDVDEKDEIICFLLSMINDSYRIMHTHVPQSMALFMNDYYQRYRKQQLHAESRQQQNNHRRGKGNNGRNSTSHQSIGSLSSYRNSIYETAGTGANAVSDYESINMITFKTSLKAMSAISRKAINDLSNQIFFQCDLRAYFLAGFDEFFGFRNTMAKYLSVTGGNVPNTGNANLTYTYSKRQHIYSFVTRTPLDTLTAANVSLNNTTSTIGKEATDEEDTQHTTMETLLATVSDFFLFVKDHLNISDLEKIFYLTMKKILLRYLLFIRDFHIYIDGLKRKLKMTKEQEIRNSNLASAKSKSFFTHKITPKKKKAAAASTGNEEDENNHEDENEDESNGNHEKGEIGPDPSAGEVKKAQRESDDSLPLERQGSMFRGSNWFRFQNNPLLTNENYEEAVYDTWVKDCRVVMKFYSEMKVKLFPPAVSSIDRLKKSRTNSSLDEYDDGATTTNGNASPNGGGEEEQPEELYDDEKNSPYKQTITLLLNFLSHCIILSRTEEIDNNQVNIAFINNFIANGFGIMLPVFVLDPIKYHPEVEKLFRSDPAFTHFSPSIPMIKYQKKLMLSQITGEPVIPDEGDPISIYSSNISSMHLHAAPGLSLPFPSGGSRMPMSVCNIQICNLAAYHVLKHKNLFLKISMNDKRFVTSIAPNIGDTPHWSDVFLVERTPITSCKSLTIELYAFKLRAFKMMREYKIGEVTINLIEVLRNETAHLNDAPTKSLFSSFSGDKKTKKLSNQWESSVGSPTTPTIMESYEGESNINSPHFNGFNHTAWYVVPSTPAKLFRGRKNQKSFRSSSFSVSSPRRPSISERSTQVGLSSQNNISYIFALASKGPREDVEDPQIRITLKVHIL